MKIALALSGGGTKGAYQVGFFRSIIENNIPYHIVVGTSIGAINGALIVQKDFGLLEQLWNDIELHQIMNQGVNLDIDEIMKMNKRDLIVLLQQYMRNRGLDNRPFKQLVNRYANVDKLHASDVEFAVKIASFPKIVGIDINIKKVDRNDIVSYLIASASCFPAFPIMTIDNNQYIDGGYVDRLPIDLAFAYGADHIIAVDLSNKGPIHPKYVNNPRVTYIKSVHNLGPFMLVKKEVIQRNIILGYLDTNKALGLNIGFKYTFKADISNEEEALQVHQMLSRYSTKQLTKLINIGHESDTTPFKEYLRMLEILAEVYQVNPYRIYTLDEMKSIIDQNIEMINEEDLVLINENINNSVAKLKKMTTTQQLAWIKSMIMKNIIFEQPLLKLIASELPVAFFGAIFYIIARK